MPVRVGLRPTPCITISEPGTEPPATIQNAAAEMSPGTPRVRAEQPLPARHRHAQPVAPHLDAERLEPTFRMVTRGERFDRRVVVPVVCSPASSTALLTCALGTSGA